MACSILGATGASGLCVFHTVCAVLHFVSMMSIPLYVHVVPGLDYYKPPVEEYSLAWTWPAYTLLVIFFGVSVIEHACAATCSAAIGWARWSLYGVSAPVMMVIVGYEIGIEFACL